MTSSAPPAPPAAPPAASLARGVAMLALLAFVWGFNWPAMKLAVAEVPVWQFRLVCALVGLAALFALARAGGHSLRPPPGAWKILALLGLLNVTGWQIFSAIGLQHIDSGRAAIVGYTMPLMTAMLAVPFLGERLTARVLAALALGMAGMACLLPWGQLSHDALAGIGFMLLAALSWACGTILLKRTRLPMSTTLMTAWQFVFALPALAIGALSETPVDPTALSLPALLGALYAATMPMALGYWLWFRLVEVMPASIAAIANLATPVIGVISGALVLGEAIGWREMTALALVFTALVIVLYGKPSKQPE
jgi:drug/metabolite transporter (DMT)-like permease